MLAAITTREQIENILKILGAAIIVGGLLFYRLPSWQGLAVSMLMCLLAAGCEGLPLPVGRRRAIPELRHHGFRRDLPPEDRGNAVFEDIEWSDDGSVFMTLYHLSPNLRAWDARSGTRLSSFPATLAENLWFIDGRTRRFVGRTHRARGLAVFDLTTGATCSWAACGSAPMAAVW